MSPCSSDCIFRALSALSGVQSLRILESYELVPTHLPEPPAPVHRERDVEQPAEAGSGAMVAESLRSHDAGELLEVRLFRREQRITFEEGDDAFQEVVAVPHHEDQGPIASTVRPHASATQPRLDQLEHLSPVAVLADVELRDELKPDAASRIALHRDRETAFSVDVTRDVTIQPFLLIVRTRHVVTTVNVRSDVDDE